jgi:hypothetical protein
MIQELEHVQMIKEVFIQILTGEMIEVSTV